MRTQFQTSPLNKPDNNRKAVADFLGMVNGILYDSAGLGSLMNPGKRWKRLKSSLSGTGERTTQHPMALQCRVEVGGLARG